jgi:hypothetical protein
MSKKLILLAVCALGGYASMGNLQNGSEGLVFREDFKEIPAAIPINQTHIANAELKLALHGPAANVIKKSHHDSIKNDPYYVWSGLCKGKWAISLSKSNALIDLSSGGRFRVRTKQYGYHILKIVLGLEDGEWLVSDRGFGETPDWHVFEVDASRLRWRTLDMETVKAGETVKEPDLTRVRSVGWTDLREGEGSAGCTRLDWIEVYGREVRE